MSRFTLAGVTLAASLVFCSFSTSVFAADSCASGTIEKRLACLSAKADAADAKAAAATAQVADLGNKLAELAARPVPLPKNFKISSHTRAGQYLTWVDNGAAPRTVVDGVPDNHWDLE